MGKITQEMAFEAVSGLVAKRSGAGFLGGDIDLASQIFRRSLIGDAFPSFWLEVPLFGESGFDLHVYYDRGQVRPNERFAEGRGFGMQALFDWYFGTETGGVGVGFAHDLRGGRAATGAYVNFNKRPLADAPGFFRALDAEDEYAHVAALLGRLSKEWHPWYVGLFPERPDAGVRVGSFVLCGRQMDYVSDPGALVRDLELAGFDALDDEMIDRLRVMATLPYRLELQLDVTAGGVGDTLSADLTLGYESAETVSKAFSTGGPGARACALLESWGVADERWRRIADASLSMAVPVFDGKSIVLMLISCRPAFIKVKWIGTRPQPAKVYLQCETRLMG